MLSREENELLTRTGPGTAMGEVMRRYWIPARIVRLGYKDCQRNLGNSGWQGLAFALDPARHGERRQGCPRRTHEARNPHEASTQPGRSCLRYGWSAV